MGTGAQRTVSSATPAAVAGPKLELFVWGDLWLSAPQGLPAALSEGAVKCPPPLNKYSFGCLRKQPPSTL